MKRVLTIAGSDSGGGAGIQADLKTITVLGAYGSSVITALTAQNTKGVQGVYAIPSGFVGDQINSVLSDIGADSIKTGMLANAEIIEAVASRIKSCRVRNVVIDPVLLAKGGHSLTQSEAIPALKEKLFPLAHVITPNLEEASALAGFPVTDLKDMEKAARKLHSFGPSYVLIKGGHLPGDPVDLLYDGEDFHHFTVERLITENTHGTGCTFSAALATFLAQGFNVVDAVAKAKYFVTLAIKASFPLGKGTGPTNPFAFVEKETAKFKVLQELDKAFSSLKETPVGKLIPEVQSNIAFALPFAIDESEVAGFPGRIVALHNYVASVSGPAFGASHHMARLVLAIMGYNSEFRSAMNIRYDEDILKRCRQLKWKIASFDRLKEPPEIKRQEGASLKWGIKEALKNTTKIPDVIYDKGDMGKEPMIRVLGRHPGEVVGKVLSLA